MVLVLIASNLFLNWMRISLRHHATCRQARASDAPDRRLDEFEEALVCVTAAAFCLEAVANYFSSLVPAATIESWKRNGTRRASRIFETLRCGFSFTGDTQQQARDFKWLFGLRNDAVHFESEARPPVPHPGGPETSQEFATFTLEAAERAVTLALKTLHVCVGNPKLATRAWAEQFSPSIEALAKGGK